MKDPELRTPAEWAEDLRTAVLAPGFVYHGEEAAALMLVVSEARELADRLDDLTEALRLLRVWLGPEPWKQPLTDAAKLVAKYATEED